MIRARAAAASASLVLVACLGGESRPSDEHGLGQSRSAVVGGKLSTAAEDFTVFLTSSIGGGAQVCGATVLAPNLIVTVKHCVYTNAQEDTKESDCGLNGEPTGSGGFVGDPIPVSNLLVYAGADGRKQFQDKMPAAALGQTIVDDRTKAKCSRDIAFVVLDRPLTVPPAHLRLGSRPRFGESIGVAGWGRIEERESPYLRFVRTGIDIRVIGAATADGAGSSPAAIRTFETGPGACSGDSGGPAFLPETSTVLGVIDRARNTDPNDPVSPCLPSTVAVIDLVIGDFPELVHEAFATAKAEPTLEGRSAPGWVRFGEACTSGGECEGSVCLPLTSGAQSTCNVDCRKGAACPTDYACGAAGHCEPTPPAPDAGPTTSSSGEVDAAPAPPPAKDAAVDDGGCSVGRPTQSPRDSAAALALVACALLGLRRRMRSSPLGSLR